MDDIKDALLLLTALVTLATAAIGMVMSWRNGRNLRSLEVRVDGRLTELLSMQVEKSVLEQKAARAEGVIEGEDRRLGPLTQPPRYGSILPP